MMNTNELKKDKLLNKKDLLDVVINDPDLDINNFKKMKVNELRDYFKITHLIDGKLRDMRGYCFSCITPLKADYTSSKSNNYCADCL
jgi:hypothetical protein